MGSTIRTIIWVVVFATAFIATHTPVSAHAQPIVNDKLLHYLGFMFLSGLTIWRLRAGGRRISVSTAGAWFLALLVYAAFDEITQAIPYFHRSCEFFDWLADAGGAIIGISIMLGFQYVQDRLRLRVQSQTNP